MMLLTLFLAFFRIGLFCFGGAFGMIPLMEETVLTHGWMTEQAFYDFVGVCESTPGPIAVNLATYIGSVQAGLAGSIAATLGVVTPSFVIILLIASVMKHLTENRYFRSFMTGVKPVIVALILSTGAVLAVEAAGKFEQSDWTADPVSLAVLLLLVGASVFAKRVLHKKIPAVLLIGMSAGLGIVCSLLGEWFR